MLTGNRVRVAVQIPAGRFLAALWRGVYVRQRRPDLFITSELGVTCDQDEETVGVRLDAASRQRGLYRLLVARQMIKYPGLAARFSQGLKARRDVDTVAEDVVVVEHDV